MLVDSITTVAQFFQSADTKFYIMLIGGMWTAFRGFNWVRDIREKDLRGIKEDLGAQTTVIGNGFANLSDGIRELRNDFRTFYIAPDPLMLPVSARTTRKRNSVSARSEAKKRKPATKKAK